MLLILIITAINISLSTALDMYKIESVSNQGTLEMKAYKTFPFWKPSNRTYYMLKLKTGQNL